MTILIASPGDVAEQRDVVERTIHDWNARGNAAARNVVLLPERWELDSLPQAFAGDGQAVVNGQLVARADIIYAVFHHRLGTPTARRYASGTVEELEQAHKQGSTVRVWMSEAPLPYGLEIPQFLRLREYRARLEQTGPIGTFSTTEELAWKVRGALDHDVQKLQSDVSESDDPNEGSLGDDALDGSDVGELDDLSAGLGISGVALPPRDAAAELLWPIEHLHALIRDDRVSLQRVREVLDVLVEDIDKYHSTSQPVDRLGVSRNALRGSLSGLSRYVRNTYPELNGAWPFTWDWGANIVDEHGLRTYPAETHYYVSQAQAEQWLLATRESR